MTTKLGPFFKALKTQLHLTRVDFNRGRERFKAEKYIEAINALQDSKARLDFMSNNVQFVIDTIVKLKQGKDK